MFGNILLGLVSICTFISYFPQIIKILKTKDASDLSIQSWILWVVSSISYYIYALFYNGEIMLIIETGLEALFCLIILFLSIEYRKSKLNA